MIASLDLSYKVLTSLLSVSRRLAARAVCHTQQPTNRVRPTTERLEMDFPILIIHWSGIPIEYITARVGARSPSGGCVDGISVDRPVLDFACLLNRRACRAGL